MNDKPVAVTMWQIAQESGVTKATVSMALRNSPRISEKTRKHVMAVADRLGYRHNPLVSALMTHIRGTRPPSYKCNLAYIDHLPLEETLKRPVYEAYYTGAIRRGQELGFKVEHFTLGRWGLSGPKLSDVLRNQGIQGVIIAPMPGTQRHIRLNFGHFACVAIGYSLWKPDIHRICNHQYRTALIAARELRRRGYRRAAVLIDARDNERTYYSWAAGFHVAAESYSDQMEFITFPEEFIHNERVVRWLDKIHPDAVVAIDSFLLQELVNGYRKVPEELGIVDLDCLNNRHLDFSGVDQNSELIGATAAETVISQIQRNERGIPLNPNVILISGKWFEGKTLLKKAPQHVEMFR